MEQKTIPIKLNKQNFEYSNQKTKKRKVTLPSVLMAPSVPGGTFFKVVIKYVVLPYAFPISEPIVSESLVAKEAKNPTFRVSIDAGQT